MKTTINLGSIDQATAKYVLLLIGLKLINDRINNLPTDDQVTSGSTEGFEDPDMASVFLYQQSEAGKEVAAYALQKITREQKEVGDIIFNSKKDFEEKDIGLLRRIAG